MEKELEKDGFVCVLKQSLQKTWNGKKFPLVLSPSDSHVTCTFDQLLDWLKKHRKSIQDAMKEYGAVLFRGFACVCGAKEFNDFVEAIGAEALPYIGGAAPRTQVYRGVHTSNESPPSEPIPFHCEMAQVPNYPSSIYFYAEVPAKNGGATPILRTDVLYEILNEKYPEFMAKLEAKGVVYTRVLPCEDDASSAIGRGWKSTFQTQDKQIAEEKAKSLGLSLKWLPNGNVESVSSVLPAIKQYNTSATSASNTTMTTTTTRKVFFNSIVAAYTGWRDSRNTPENAVKYGDGSKLEPQLIEQISSIMQDTCYDIQWEKCDVVCIDNNLCMHSRRTFEPPRRVLAYVAK